MRVGGRHWRTGLAAAVLFALGSLTGCKTVPITVQLPGYGSGNVQGIWLWRLSSSTGQYERACRIDFSAFPASKKGQEQLGYEQTCPNPDDFGMPLHAVVSRSAADPTTITVTLYYLRWVDAGIFKASAYNSSGESTLSASSLDL
jgi:hypothetical protein